MSIHQENRCHHLQALAVYRNYYVLHSAELKKNLISSLGQKPLQELHQRNALRHFLVLLRQILFLGGATYFLFTPQSIWVWVLAILVQGFTVFNFTVMLHEVVHRTVFAKDRPFWYKVLGYLYAIPSGISASQFNRWHMGHQNGGQQKPDTWS